MARAGTSTEMAPIWHQGRFHQLSLNNLYDIMHLRQQVFVIEQDCLYQDLDGLDRDAHHLWCYRGDVLQAYLRSLPPQQEGGYSIMGRIVTAPPARGTGLGRELVARGIAYNCAQWPNSCIKIGAQAHLEGFYEEYGFLKMGDVYDEDGIPHIDMVLEA